MISNLARWLVRKRLSIMADWMLTCSSVLIGKGTRIHYQKKGYWSHRQKGWIVNEAYPNIRLDIQKLQQFNEAVYLHEYRPQPDDIIVDLGAGIGTESIFLSRTLGEKGKIYAIEASPVTYKILLANITDNKLENVQCSNIAIADHHGKLKISEASETHINNSIFEDEGVEVEAFTMDEFFAANQIEKVNFLKVNIEGAEKLLVRAFNSIVNVHHIAISCHDFLAKRTNNPVYLTKETVVDFLLRNHFEITSRQTGIDYEDDWIYGRNTAFTRT